MGLLATAHLLRRTRHQNTATTSAPFRAQINDPVRGFDDVQVVLDDDDGVAPIPQLVQYLEQLLDIVEVQPRGRFVQDVEGLASVPLGELPRQLDPLRLAARERGSGLTEPDVGEAHVHQGLQLARHRRHRIEEGTGIFHRHLEDFVDVLALVLHLQGLAVVALALADVARHVDVRQEVHLHLDDPVPLARLAAPPLHVEGEAARLVATGTRLLGAGEQLADRGEQSGVGGRVGARGAADGALVDIHHLVQMLQPLDAAIGRRCGLGGLVELAVGDAEQGVVDQGRLAGTGDAGDAGHHSDGQIQVDVAQVVAASPFQFQPLAGERGTLGRDGDLLAPGEVVTGQGLGVRDDLLRRPLGDDGTAVHAGPRADVEHMVGEANGILVVLHHDHRVAQIAQMGEGLEQPLVVALMQTDGGLVQHVHDPHQASPDLAGQPDPLRLATGEGLGTARQAQIVEADVHQEAEPLDDLLEDLVRYLGTLTGQVQPFEEGQGIADGLLGDGRQVAIVHEDVAGFFPQSAATATGTGLVGDVFGQLFPHRVGFGLPVAALHVVQDPLERVLAHHHVAAVIHVAELDLGAPGTAQDHLLGLERQILPGGLQVELVVIGQGFEHLEVVEAALVPTTDGAASQALARIMDELGGIEILLHPETVTGGTSPRRVVEGEDPGLQLRHGVTALGAGEVGGEGHGGNPILPVHRHHQHDAAGESQRRFERFGQAQGQVIAHLEAIHHHLDGVLLVQLQGGRIRQIAHLAVDAGADVTLGRQVLQQLGVLPLAVAHHGGQQHQLGAFGLVQHLIHHLADGLGRERNGVGRAAWLADPGEQQPQVVVNLGDGADGRARVVGGGLLLDGDGRRQPLDVVHVRLLHQGEELAGIGGEGLHIAALPLGIEGIERQGGFARTGQAGDHDQLVTWQDQVDILEVVGAGTPDHDFFHLVARSIREPERASMA